MPKARSTCTRCSQRRQKCDRQTPCSRCVANKEAHLCTTEWNGYDPGVHRRYPRKSSVSTDSHPELKAAQPTLQWPSTTISGQDIPARLRADDPTNPRHRLFSSTSTLDAAQIEPTPSSNNLDFITQGRADYSDVSISIGSVLESRDAYDRNKIVMEEALKQGKIKPREDEANIGGFSPAARAVEVYHLQSILPAKDLVVQMVDYHERNMAYWSSGIYHGPSFRKALYSAYALSDKLDLPNMDWRWTALLFSILSSSVIGCPEAISASWGYTVADKVRLAKQWGNATITCLQLGDYASKYHISSISAILNMHTSEHLVGSSKEWAVYQNGAIVIARGLGLHRLGPHPDDGKSTGLSEEQKEALLQREMGRRIWYALVSQDWLCSTSQGLYSIQKRHFTTIKPNYYDEETMVPTVDTPTYAHMGNYLHDVAYLLICYHDGMLDAPDLATKYDIVLRYDAKMRAMSIDKMPRCLSLTTPFNPAWPRWAAWARHLHQASWAHKIIMMHQAFLGRSFKESQYTYSRWACINASKTIIEELSHEREAEEAQWWIEQAFVVTAGVCLTLDVYHRSEDDPEARTNLGWIDKAVKTLESWPTSSVAIHGLRLLTSLLQEYNKKFEAASAKAPSSEALPSFENLTPTSIDNVPCGEAEQQGQAQPLVLDTAVPMESWAQMGDINMNEFGDLMDYLPVEVGMDNNMFFESILFGSNSQYY